VHFVAYAYFSLATSANAGESVFTILNELGQTCLRVAGGLNTLGDNLVQTVFNSEEGSGVSVSGADLSDTTRLLTFDLMLSNESGNVVFRMYINGALYGVATVAGAGRGMKVINFSRPSQRPSYWKISELIVSTEDTRGLSVRTILLTGNGAHAEMTGDYSDVDDPAGSDGLSLKALAADQKSSFTKAPVSGEFGSGTVIVSAIASAASGYGMVGGLRIDGVDYYGDAMDLTTGLLPGQTQFLTNPATGLQFTASEINAAEVIVKAIALP
jgi:hypothetical protein